MKHLKLFEEFIFETSSKRLEDINSAIKKMMGGTDNSYNIEFILYYILCSVVPMEKIEEVSKKKSNFREGILRHEEFDFDMDKAIEYYKKTIEYNNGHIKTGDKYKPFMKEFEYHKEALKSIENILDYYKKNKNVDSVDYHTFVEYIFKAERLMRKTDKNSELSINNIINTILKNGIDIISIQKEMRKFSESRAKDKLEIVDSIPLMAGDEFDGEDRQNNYNIPVFGTALWSNEDYRWQITTTLFVKKNEYFIGMCFSNGEKYNPIVIFRKSEKPTIVNKNGLNGLKNVLGENEKNFGKDTFKEIMENVFKIYADSGAETNFDYDYLMEIINKEVK